jgi:homoserine dehydrogenase
MSTERALSAEQALAPPAPLGERSTTGVAAVAARPCNVALLGHGTVGSAFAELLESRADDIASLCGRRPQLSGVLTRSRGSFPDVLDSAEVLVELIGGLEPARDYLLQALRAGKHVVTANKQLLCEHGEELFDAARSSGVQLRFEAAVGGVIPVVRVLQESLAGAHVERIHGIVNGTTNFILSEMAGGSTYDEALAEAQRQGIAESDPAEDVSGKDAAAKMAILARLAFATPVSLRDVRYEGIEHLHSDDLLYARELGLGLKLIGTAERLGGGISVRVHPAFLYAGHPLASVSGPFNAVTVESPSITEITMSGPGAGGVQTASAVLGDLVSAISLPAAPLPPARPLEVASDIESAFYLHVEVADRPGVLAAVAGVLGEHGASIRSVLQRGAGDHARLVMVTHKLAESRLREATRVIAELDLVRSSPRAIPVIEEEFK